LSRKSRRRTERLEFETQEETLVKQHRISIHDHDLTFATAGEGPVLVLIHGMAGCSESWKHVMPALARRFTVVAPDLLGHGTSATPRGDHPVRGQPTVVRDRRAALGH
jgi:pimeloyl-ACP methyl ester carboxylesterase